MSSSSSDIAVSVRGVSKSYTIAHEDQKHTLATEALLHSLKNIGKKPTMETFWALQDVSFDIAKGDVVGIIGRNGAGKSTLLKILSRITEPTSGQIDLYGRVGSLLEVGTGFHPELTGRENTYLNGAILGMSKREIAKHFDAIVDFSGVEKFLDTPVKRYSSGMYVRLAFAVAAHLEPEILIVDEVLAVGDAEFQKKCLGKMQDVASHGRTVIFVSHNMAAVNRLCKLCLWMEKGQLKQYSSTEEVVSSYLLGSSHSSGEQVWTLEDAPGNRKAQLRAVRIRNEGHQVSANLDIQKSFYVDIEYELHQSFSDVRVAIQILSGDGSIVFHSSDTSGRYPADPARAQGTYTSQCEIPGEFLNTGQYSVTVAADIPFKEVLFLEENTVSFVVEKTGGVSSHYAENWPGVVCPNLVWNVHASDNLVAGERMSR